MAVLAGVATAALAGCGGDDTKNEPSGTTTEAVGENAARYSGTKAEIATVIDKLQANSRSGDADTICDDLFTDKLAGTIAARNNTSCAAQVKTKLLRKDATYTIASITIRGTKAIAKVKDITGTENGMFFINQDGWKIDSIYDLKESAG